MKKYEYKIIPMDTNTWGGMKVEENEAILTEEGLNGWRYVEGMMSASGKKFFLMERQVSGNYTASPEVDTLV